MSDYLFIRFFDEPGAATVENLGGKCASLVNLTGAGMPVPPGFAVTTTAYTSFVELTGLADEIDALLAGGARGRSSRRSAAGRPRSRGRGDGRRRVGEDPCSVPEP